MKIVPIPLKNENLKKTQNDTKTSITQRLRTDFWRLIWVATATQLVWLNRFANDQRFH